MEKLALAVGVKFRDFIEEECARGVSLSIGVPVPGMD
jgi:hypothetical protein